MKNYLFIPIHSLNFNTVFSTESISPGVYYEKRNFGTKRFFPNTANHNKYCIYLYDEIPEAEPLTKEDDLFIFYIGIKKDTLKEGLNKIENYEGVFTYYSTVYLNFHSSIFVYNNQTEMESMILKSLSVLETKVLEKYKNRFYTAFELDYQKRNYELDYKSKETSDSEVTKRDEKFNLFKGLVYASVIARIFKKDTNHLKLNNALNELKNALITFNNTIAQSEDNRKYKSADIKENVKFAEKILQQSYNNFINSVALYVPLVSASERIKKLLDEKSVTPNEVEALFNIISKFPELGQFLHEYSENKSPSLNYKFESLYSSIQKLSNTFIYSSSRRNQLIEDAVKQFSEQSYLLIKDKVESNINTKHVESSINNYSFKKNVISCNDEGNTLDNKEKELHNKILNVLYLRNKPTIGQPSKEIINEIIIEIGNITKDIFGDNSTERKDLISFYNLYNDKLPGFKINKIKSSVIMNFSAFILKYKSIEELFEFCEKQYILSYHIAIEYWGIFNGFAAISKIFTRPIWKESLKGIPELLDVKLKNEFKEYEPLLKLISDEELLNIQLPERKKEIEILESNKEISITINDIYKLLESDKELSQHIKWIKKCVENIMSSLSMEYENLSPIESLKKELSAELYSKNRPRYYGVRQVDKTINMLNIDLLFQIKNGKPQH